MVNVLDALPVAVIQVDGDGRVRYANERAERLLESSGGPLRGRDVARVLAPLSTLDAAGGGAERAAVQLAGGQRTIGFHSATLGDGSRVVVFQDITQLEQTREERNRLLQMASISDVMPAVLHELKNPLASITAALELLTEDVQGGLQERLHAVLTEVRRLSLTLDGLGRFRHEVRSPRNAAIDLAIREAFALLVPQAAARGVHAQASVSDMPLLPLEPAALRSVVFNLVTNAIHACQQGQSLSLTARFDRQAQVLELAVTDTGSGMTDEVLRRCTELFFTTKPKGSGIGLALCRGVAEAVGGGLHVESSAGRGTQVTLKLPVSPNTPRT